MAISGEITSKGQVTVPIEVRRRLGLNKGDRLEFIVEEGRTFVRPVRSEENPFAQFAGILPAMGSVEEINAWIREMRGGGEDFPD